MTDKKNTLIQDKEELATLGHEMKTLLPGGATLTGNQAVSLGKYALINRANPFRGEVYGYTDKKGNLMLVDGYKLLVRWAKKISDYNDKYELLPAGVEGLKDGDIGYRCTILRDDKKSDLKFYIASGASFKEAYDLASTSAVGIILKKEMSNQYGPIDPPKGWTWDQVARKRALKNVLNMAYAMPSMDELAEDSWLVENVKTEPEDWAGAEVYKTTAEAEQHAKLAANERKRQEKVAAMDDAELAEYQENLAEANEIMRNNGDDDPLDLSPDTEEYEPANPADYVQMFWTYQRDNEIDKQVAKNILEESGGDFETAYISIKKAESGPS